MNRTDAGWLVTTPIAHRGLHDGRRPENSLPAFEAALAAGYGIELDVHLCADGRPVVMHDDDLLRMTGMARRVGKLSAPELRRLRLLDTDATVPLLADVLALVAGRVPVLIEIKPGAPPRLLGPALVPLLCRYSGPVAVQSFDPRVVAWARRTLPHVLRGQLAGPCEDTRMPRMLSSVLRNMVANAVTRPHFLAFDVEAMPSGAVSWWRRRLDVPLLLWTVRTEAQREQARGYGANVIFEEVRPAVAA